MRQTTWNLSRQVIGLILTLGFIGGCETGMTDGTPGGAPPAAENTTVDDTLTSLGVNTETTDRVDESGETLPDDFSPLGASACFSQTDELFLVGLQMRVTRPDNTTETLQNRAAFIELADDDTAEIGLKITELLDTQPWETDNHSQHPGMNGSAGSHSTRAVAVGDVDADGLDEILIVYANLDDPQNSDEIYLEILEDNTEETASRSTGRTVIASETDLRDLSAAAGDFDGDGAAEVAVGVSTSTSAYLLFVMKDADGNYVVADSATRTFSQDTANSTLSLELAAGNVDRDNPSELAVVMNEYDGPQSGSARYFIYDDANAGFAELDGNQPVIGNDGGAHVALVADVAMGDIDGDAKDEIIFGGLTEFHNNGCESYGHIHVALEDAAVESGALQPIAAKFVNDTYVEPGTGCNSNSHFIRVRKVHVNALDVDGDGVAEVQANRRVFSFGEAPWTEAYLLPHDEFLQETRTSGGTVSNASTDMVTGDVTGDGRDDVISFMQWRNEISVYGLIGPDVSTAVWQKVESIPTALVNGQTRVFPIMAVCNVDKDGLALKYSDAEYRFVFTQPIIIAALAAAPCGSGIGQNTDACVTSYGTSEGSNVGIDGTVTVSASTFVSFEAKDPFFGIGVEGRQEVTTTASFSAALSYTLEETIEYTTGPMEDTVIFTTIPLDQYTYTIASHPDPELVGTSIVVNMPRSPITLQVEREFYNNSVAEGSFRIGRNVFMHTPGELSSYPTEGDADALIDTGGLGHLGPLGELVDSAGAALGPIAERLLGRGLKASRTTTVGQGGGQTSTEIRFTENTDYRAGAEVSYESELAVTGGGVAVGASIGGSVGAGVTWGSSNSTIYRGTVGSIDSANFADNVFNFGLFTYVYNYGDRSQPQFEVINYWVE